MGEAEVAGAGREQMLQGPKAVGGDNWVSNCVRPGVRWTGSRGTKVRGQAN